MFSGEEEGYLEPCGCEQNPMGGVARRHTLLLSLLRKGSVVIPLSLGDLVGHWKRQDEIKMEVLVEALGEMQYAVHNLGEKDLEMGREVLSYAFYLSPVELLSSNIRLADPMGFRLRPYVIKEVVADGRRIRVGVLGILSPSLVEASSVLPGVEVMPPVEAIASVLKEIGDVDILVLLAHASLEESVELAAVFPGFRLVVSGHDIDSPLIENIGDTIVAACGEKGKHIGLFHYLPDAGEVHLEMVTLDGQYADSPRMLEILRDYQQRLRDEDLLGRVEKFSHPEGLTYAGNAVCSTCHPAIFMHWQTTAHAQAHQTLVRVGHEYDPECVSCHVTGLYYEGGFISAEETPGLRGIGCEGCHGQGSGHVEATLKGQPPRGYGRVEVWVCESCHDLGHSSRFEYKSYWQRIAHPKETPKG